jgi:hypothetical protein
MNVQPQPLANSPAFDPALDRREAILQRLFMLGQGISGIASVWRNHGPTETGDLGVSRPAFLLFDGDSRLTQDVTMHKATRMPPTIWEMDPQIVVLLPNRDTVENILLDGVPAPVGTELSSWIGVINTMVTNDDQLLNLVTANGTHWLASIATDLKPGRTIGAFGAYVAMNYMFRYPLFPPR